MNTRIYLASTAEYLSEAAKCGLPVAQMIYKVGRGPRLYRSERAKNIRGGILHADVGMLRCGGPVSALVRDIVGECRDRGFTGAVLSCEKRDAPGLLPYARELTSGVAKAGIQVFVPECLAGAGHNAIVLVPTAISGGSLKKRLTDAAEKYGHGRIALEIERVCSDYALQASGGSGRDLTGDEFSSLFSKHNPQPFFSDELYTVYFTYRDNNASHFVLYDTAASLQRKILLAQEIGVDNVFLFYPHVAGALNEILPD